MKILTLNKKAKFEYFFERTESAGIVLFGSEVKAIREGKVSLVDSYCILEEGEIFIKGMNIPNSGNAFSHEPIRQRKLLLKKKEIQKLEKDLIKGLTIIPYSIYESDRGILKMEICLSKGKKLIDKREVIKTREIERNLRRGDF